MKLTNPFRAAEQVVTADEKFNAASALSAYAVSTFDRVVTDLEEANAGLTEVEDEVFAELERLQTLMDATDAQRTQNARVIAKVRALTA